MPKILINEKTTQLIFEVRSYAPSDENKHHMWCVVRIGIHNDHINFDKTDTFLMNYEIEELADWLYKILNGEKVKSLDEDFYKPDIHFTAILPWNVGLNEKDNNLQASDFDPLLLVISIEFRTKGSYLGEKWTTVLNEKEIREFYNQLKLEIDRLVDLAKKKDERYLCAIATYEPDFGKEYTFFVHDKADDAIWYVDGSYKQVYVVYFQELAIDELPVDYQKMKKIIPVNKESHIFKKILNGGVKLLLTIDDSSIYCYISFPSDKYIFNFEKLSIEEIDAYYVWYILGSLYMEGIYSGSEGYVLIFDDIYFDNLIIEKVKFELVIDEYSDVRLIFNRNNIDDIVNACQKVAEVLNKYKLDKNVIDKAKAIVKIKKVFEKENIIN